LRAAAAIDDVPRAIRNLKQQGWAMEDDGRGNNRLTTLAKGEARGARRGVSERVRYEVLQASGFRCRGCGAGVDDGVKLVIDHLVLVDWGGTNDMVNLRALCVECNHGKQAWVADQPADAMGALFRETTVEARIEALFDALPDQEVPSVMLQMASRNAFDWQRALRRVRQRTGKRIVPVRRRTAYRYFRS
jgi:hypothetical protein